MTDGFVDAVVSRSDFSGDERLRRLVVELLARVPDTYRDALRGTLRFGVVTDKHGATALAPWRWHVVLNQRFLQSKDDLIVLGIVAHELGHVLSMKNEPGFAVGGYDEVDEKIADRKAIDMGFEREIVALVEDLRGLPLSRAAMVKDSNLAK